MLRARIFEIKRFAVHDGDGIRTTVFFKGCPLRCVWCHNPEGITPHAELAYYAHKCVGCGACVGACAAGAHGIAENAHRFARNRCTTCGSCQETCMGDALQLYGKEMSVEELMPLLLADKDFYDTSSGGITLSGGECLLQAEFCAALLQECRASKLHTAVDTCGYVPWHAFARVAPYTDVFLFDIKAMNEDVHIRCTGHSNKTVLDSFKRLDALGCKTEIRIPYVPGYNDSEIPKIAAFLSELDNVTGVRVLPYHNYAGSKYAALGINNTLPERVPTAEEIAVASNYFQAALIKGK